MIAWLAPTTPGQPGQPEVVLVGPDASNVSTVWPYVRWLLDATQFDPAFTLDPAGYAAIAGNGGDTVFSDYDNDAAMTIRFGDGVFGAVPTPGATFTLFYRAGVASLGNVAAGAINNVVTQGLGILGVTNPLPASGGAEAQTLESVRRLALRPFAVQYRAVIPTDYEGAAETLPWVQRAGTVFRWTGSWLTVFTTPNPLGSQQITLPRRTAMIELLNRYRMAGYESYVPDPNYVSLDLVIQICGQPTAFQGDVEAAVLTALGTGAGGFFNFNKFTFGQPLWLSALETAVQNAHRRRGRDLRSLSGPGPHRRLRAAPRRGDRRGR